MKACRKCGVEIPETDLWCHECRQSRIAGKDITPAIPPLLPGELDGFKVPPTGTAVIDECGREVDSLALAKRYRNETLPVGIWSTSRFI